MFNRIDIRPLIIIAVNILYLFVLSTINGEIAPYVSLFLPALFIIPAALYLGFGGMVFTVAFTAFLFEAGTPVRAGLTAAAWLVCAFFVHGARFRFRTNDYFPSLFLAEVVNAVILLFQYAAYPRGCESWLAYSERAATDAFVSSFALVLVAQFAIAVPAAFANICGISMSVSERD